MQEINDYALRPLQRMLVTCICTRSNDIVLGCTYPLWLILNTFKVVRFPSSFEICQECNNLIV